MTAGQLDDRTADSSRVDPQHVLAALMTADADATRDLIYADPTTLDDSDRALQAELWAAGPEVSW